MNNIAIVNGIDLADSVFKPLKNGLNTLQLVYQFTSHLPGIEQVVLLTSAPLAQNPGFHIEELASWERQTLLERMQKLAKGCAHVFYCHADTPYLDAGLAEIMYTNHKKYFAEYSFADGYPAGLTIEIFNPAIIGRLLKLADAGPVKRDTLFDIIKKDINSFDVETEISPVDMRMLRVELFANTKRNFLLLQQLAACDSAVQIMEMIKAQPIMLRTLPAYYSIQIAGDCPQACSYCPYPAINKEAGSGAAMPPDQFYSLLKQINNFSGDAVIDLSPWGDPACHPQIGALIQSVLAYNNFKLIIETAGIGWDRAVFQSIKQSAKEPPVWIISLDTADKALYSKLRGDGYEVAHETAATLLTLFPQHTYIQAVRMVDNEDDLEQFYDYWKKRTENIIVQKYDSFCNVLPARQVTDLSPVKRFPCWHIKRDLHILLDGTVTLCHEDLGQQYPLGSVFNETLEQIWEKGNRVYQEHLAGKYNELCEKCDEYYTYNF